MSSMRVFVEVYVTGTGVTTGTDISSVVSSTQGPVRSYLESAWKDDVSRRMELPLVLLFRVRCCVRM
jgi:hypothetical protein